MCDKTTGASLDTLVSEDLDGKVAFINGYVGGVGGLRVLEKLTFSLHFLYLYLWAMGRRLGLCWENL